MESVKGYNRLREALLMDALHMTAPQFAMMLAGAAFFEPPENEED